MNCEEARMLLDAYIDGELFEAEKRALMDHVEACEECAQELEAAKLLRDVLLHIDEDVQVPLETQAAWRSAVRTEAKKKNTQKWMRMAYAAAAALVLVIGGAFAFREMPNEQPEVMTLGAGVPVAANELIARDGLAEPAVVSGIGTEDCTVWKKISSKAFDQDREALKMLAAEYGGRFEQTGTDVCRIELSGEYVEDFMNAASRIGTELYSEVLCDNAAEAVIIIQFCEE